MQYVCPHSSAGNQQLALECPAFPQKVAYLVFFPLWLTGITEYDILGCGKLGRNFGDGTV